MTVVTVVNLEDVVVGQELPLTDGAYHYNGKFYHVLDGVLDGITSETDDQQLTLESLYDDFMSEM